MLNFKQYTDMTECWIGNNVVLSTNDFSEAFQSHYNLINLHLPSTGITNMHNMCSTCYNLKTIACGNNVINLSNAYYYCDGLKCQPECGDNVIDMY